MSRKVYPTDVSDEEWEFVVSYLTLIREDAGQRVHALRDVFDAVRWMVKAGCPWRMLPGDFPPWQAVEQQGKRWMEAECFESLTHDLARAGASARRTATRARRRRSSMGARCKAVRRAAGELVTTATRRKNGSKVHVAVDTLGHLLALVGDARQRTGARPGRRTGQAGPAGHAKKREAGLRRSRLHGRETRDGGGGPRHRVGSGQTG